jgi:hypothetical protein
VTEQLSRMPAQYDRLAWELSRRLHGRVQQVFITEYPADIFQNTSKLFPPPPHTDRSGCGALFLIDDGEGTFIFEKGQEFNQVIQTAAQLHGWGFVSGIVDLFNTHGYCDEKPFYVARKESLRRQGNEDGTIHPNNSGQLSIRDRILETVRRFKFAGRRSKQITVVFEKIKCIDPGTGSIFINIFLGANGQERKIASLARNQEILLPAKIFSFTFFVDDGLAGPFVEVTGRATSKKDSPENRNANENTIGFSKRFSLDEKFGEGPHVRNGPDLELHYRISVKNEPIIDLPPGPDNNSVG